MNKFMKIVDWFKGKKTFFVIGAALAMINLEALGVIPDGTYAKAEPTFQMLGLGTMSAKLNRMLGK